MKPALAEHRITRLIHDSGHARVYEAVAVRDGREYIVKVFDIGDDTVAARVRHEFELIEALDIEGVVRAESLQRVGDQLVLVLERAPGVNLSQLAGGEPVELGRFFEIAGQIAQILAETHASRVIHRDIKPANLLFDPVSGRAHIADFGISVLLEHERRHIYDEQILVGTLPYLSPEQTGRTNRKVDFRSDLYSLGVTFYELLTGRRPFEYLSPLEMIHAHLARRPRPPRELRPQLPEPLSHLVMRLLEKAPERRYQTAAGLAADLLELAELHAAGSNPEQFELGRHDHATSLQLPHQLYGRAREEAELRASLDAVVEGRGRHTILICGPSGVGKSALSEVLDIAAVGHGGLILRGKFDAERELPYAGFVDAFAGWCEQLLTESDARLVRWRRRLTKALGGLANVACEFVPNLAMVLGSQPASVELGPIESRNRLLVMIDRLLGCLCEEAPVVLMLDDLHLADHGSAVLLDSLGRGAAGPLLLTATLREEQVGPEHPLRALIDQAVEGAIDKVRPDLSLIRVEPLPAETIAQLLRDTLGEVAELDALAAIVARKTGGVPLFIAQFLTDLVARAALRVGLDGVWEWTREAVETAQIPDDAVTIMRGRLDELREEDRELLGRAACLGARFELSELALVCRLSPGELVARSFALIEAGLIFTVGRGFRFTHDSIRAAAGELLGDAERRRVHWTVGRHMVDSEDGEVLDEQLFEVVEHLVAGQPKHIEAGHAAQLAGLELRAGRRALDSAAYDFALRNFDHGLELLARDGVAAELDALGADVGADVGADLGADLGADVGAALGFGLGFGRAQALALANRRDEANAAFEALLAEHLPDHQFGLVVARRLRLLQLENRQHEAVALGREALARLGAPLPSKVGFLRGVVATTRAWLELRKLDLDGALAIPACEDPRRAALVEIVAQLKYPAFVADNNLFVYLSALHALMLREHGFHETSPLAIADLSVSVSGGLDKAGEADCMLELAFELCERLAKPEPVRVGMMAIAGALNWHRTRAYADFLHEFEQGHTMALELGEFDHAAFMASFSQDMQLDTGTHLAVLDRSCRESEHDNARRGAVQMEIVSWVVGSVCAELLGDRAVDDGRPRGLDQLTPEAIQARGGVATNEYTAWTDKALAALVLGQRERAVELVRGMVGDMDKVMFNSWLIPRAYTVGSVAYYAGVVLEGRRERDAAKWLRKCAKLLRSWAQHSPGNYAHQLDLVLGLEAAAHERMEEALAHLDHAWAGARTRGCRWVEGLAAEFIAALLERRGARALVDGAWRRAWDAYAAWGAHAKLELLRVAKPGLFNDVDLGRHSSSSSSPGSSSSMTGLSRHTAGSSSSQHGASSQSLDLEAVLRSVGVITEELRLEEVIVRVLDAAVTNVGADNGQLLLERGGELALVAETSFAGESGSGSGSGSGDGDGGAGEGEGSSCAVLPNPISLRELGDRGPSSVVNFVTRTGKSLVLDDVRSDSRFADDPYLRRNGVRSLLATPIIRNELLGVMVLENRLGSHGFSPTSIETLRLITGQAASTLDNARLYAALRRSEARWRSLVDGAPDLIALLDERGELVFVNRGTYDLDGQHEFVAAMTERSQASWAAGVEQAIESGIFVELELELTGEVGEVGDVGGSGPRWYAVRIAPINLGFDARAEGELVFERERLEYDSQSGRVRNAVAVATDITDRKHAEAERAQLEAQLRQQQRLESLGTLASGVAHEINNPIQGIMNYAELLAANPDDRETVVEFAAEIGHETERVATIVKNLLAFSRQEREHQLEDVEVEVLVQGTLSLINAVLRKDQITIDLELQPAKVHCRIQQIQQIIMNLVTNARDALNLVYPGYDVRKRIKISNEASAQGRVRICVEDGGPGIPPEVLTHIFDPFFTTKGRDNGTGLGLAVSHGIAQEHGGELTVDTKVGEGARFYLDLPSA